MSQRMPDYEDLRARQARAQEPATTQCEAERRIKQVLYVMENDWGAGSFDYTKIRGMLAGRDTPKCSEHEVTHGKIGV